ncbi:MAG: polysaccharide transporter [Clostridia bacterium]
MRLENSIKNIVIALICNTLNIIISFIAQSIFIKTLGTEYAGLNGVFTNIISMLSIVELGIGSQIIYHLYKPIAENNIIKIKQLMNFYRKSYNRIAIVVLLLGIFIMPFINLFIGENNISENIYFIYLLFVLDSVVSYLIAYKRSILYANQQSRYVDLVHIVYVIIMNTVQIAILLTTKNYIIYLIIKIICRLLENLVIDRVANKFYSEIMKDNKEKLDDNTVSDIKKRVKALIFHQIGGYLVLGTDSIIISKFLGLSVAGIYANYVLIFNSLNLILSQIFTAITSSVGNLLTENNEEKSYLLYKRLMLLNFWIYGLSAIGIYITINTIIIIWLGVQYTFLNITILALSINFFSQGMRRVMQTFAAAGGICYENRFVPIIEATVNLAVSIILVKLIGLTGVVIGTFVSSLVLHLYSFPVFIYEPIFKKEKNEYIVDYLKYLAIFLITLIVTYLATKFINIDGNIMRLVFQVGMCLIIVNLIFYILFRKSEEFKYYLGLLYKLINKIRGKNNEAN